MRFRSWMIGLTCGLVASPIAVAAQTADTTDDWDAARHVRVDWVYVTMKQPDIVRTLDNAMKDQVRWANLPQNSPDVEAFRCVKLALPPPTPAALAAFESAPSSMGRDADKAYAKAASLGYWRAAARLVNSALDDEDWESAQPIVAWLLKHHVPAGYNKLADMFYAMSSYDGESPGADTSAMIVSLRWRAALEGDPVAQTDMADLFAEPKPKVAASLRACASGQNPGLAGP
ncbi:hypothetical protein [Burkholderia guangdongensis]|uniref:hypothetical protein n=1 Tax=Burkholderia guangdongensis TaxID=1792500 RepID=UPI0015C6C2B9|nr:hypothetical protein [Burkholderia guangdongensis]